jgi:heme-degrading monooxygenase HmoA
VSIFVYLRFCLAESADREVFDGDIRAMAELAENQPGYIWSQMGPSMQEPSVYVVVSEWSDLDDVRSWEHERVQTEIQRKWEPHFSEPLVHRRFTPWQRPTEA